MTCACPTCGQNVAETDGVRWNHLTGVLFAKGQEVRFSPRKADIFEVLYCHAPAMVVVERIMTCVYGSMDHPEDKSVKVHICLMNKALRGSGLHIANHWGRGYSIVFSEVPG